APILDRIKWHSGSGWQRWQRLLLSVPTRQRMYPRLRKLTYGRTAGGSEPAADAVLSWYASETNPDGAVKVPDRRPLIRLPGRMSLPPEARPPAAGDIAAGQSAADLITRHLADPSVAALIDWKMAGFSGPDYRWLNFGSIDIRPKAPAQKMQINYR